MSDVLDVSYYSEKCSYNTSLHVRDGRFSFVLVPENRGHNYAGPWGHMGPLVPMIWAHMGSLWIQFGPSWGQLGLIWTKLGSMFAPVGPMLGPNGAQFGSKSGPSWAPMDHMGPFNCDRHMWCMGSQARGHTIRE
jgi:hypothetical protein